MNDQHPEIPKGHYCYSINSIEYGPKDDKSAALAKIFGDEDRGLPILHTTKCPHWGKDPTKPDQENGYCTLLGINDWDGGTLLWDQVKECDFNLEDPDLDHYVTN